MTPFQTLTLSYHILLLMLSIYLSNLPMVLVLGHPVMKCLVVNNIFLSLLWDVVNCPHLSYSAWMHHSALFVLVFTPQAVSACDLYLHGVYDVVVRCAGATNVFFRNRVLIWVVVGLWYSK